MGNLLVSIIVVSKNAKDTIKRCLDSILAQTYANLEVVIVDSSNDGTEKIIEEYKNKSKFPFKIIFQAPKGVGAARNEGLRNAEGSIIVSIDTDMFIPPDFVEKIVQAFKTSDKVMGVLAKNIIQSENETFFSNLIRLYEKVLLIDLPMEEDSYIELVAKRKEFSDMIGEFEEDLEVGEDYVYWKKLKKLKRKLEDMGFKFPIVDTSIIEKKRAQTFKEYWKKSMWYGEAFSSKKYIASDFRNVVKLIGSLYLFFFPIGLMILFVIGIKTMIIILFLSPLFFIPIYTYYKMFRKKIFLLNGLLIPLVLYYKAIFTALGFIKKISIDRHRTYLIMKTRVEE